MLELLLFTGLIVAAPTTSPLTLNRIPLPSRHTFTRSTGEVDGPALLDSLQRTLNKYHTNITIPGTSANASLQRRLAIENLVDQVAGQRFDGRYYGPMQVGSRTGLQGFNVQFDTGSADVFIPGPQCTSDDGCPLNTKYSQGGVSQGQTTTVDYGSGSVQGNLYTDSITVAGLTATNQALISITQAAGFDTSASDGLLGMGFTPLSASGYTTFFENLIGQDQVAAPEFSFYLGRADSGTSQRSSLCLGCADPTHYTGPVTKVPVTVPAYWQIVLNGITVDRAPASASTGSTIRGQAIIDTGTTLVLAPTAAAYAVFRLIPNAFPVPITSSSGAGPGQETFFAYPCSTAANLIPAIRFGGKAFAINPLDFNFGILTPSFARLVGNESLAVRLEHEMAKMAKAKRGHEEEKGKEKRAEAGEQQAGYQQYCVAALAGTDSPPQGDLFVVGDAFLKNWYTTFNYGGGGVRPSVSFAQAV